PPRCAGAGEAAEENAPEPRFETSAARGEKAQKQNEKATVDVRLILPHAVDAIGVEVAAVPRARQRDEVAAADILEVEAAAVLGRTHVDFDNAAAVVVARLLAMAAVVAVAAVVAPCPVAMTIFRGSGRRGEHGQRGRCCDETCDFPGAFHVFSPRELNQRTRTIAIGPPTFSPRPIQ